MQQHVGSNAKQTNAINELKEKQRSEGYATKEKMVIVKAKIALGATAKWKRTWTADPQQQPRSQQEKELEDQRIRYSSRLTQCTRFGRAKKPDGCSSISHVDIGSSIVSIVASTNGGSTTCANAGSFGTFARLAELARKLTDRRNL